MKNPIRILLLVLVGLAAAAAWLGVSFLSWVVSPKDQLRKDSPTKLHDVDYARTQAKTHRTAYNRLREKHERSRAEQDAMLKELWQANWWENAAKQNKKRATR